MSNENTNDQQKSNSTEQTTGFWKKHGKKITLAATGVGIAAAGIAAGMALKTAVGPVAEFAEAAADSATE